MTRLRRREYISPDIVNELIKIMGQCVLRKLLTEIRASLWYSILVDEDISDISHNEQMFHSLGG